MSSPAHEGDASANFGAEEYWHGLLRHDRSESPGFAEIAATVKELKALGPAALHAGYLADAALLFDYSSDWVLTIQPGQPKLKYQNEILTWYSVAAAGGALLDLVDRTGDLSRYKVIFAPTLYVLSEAQAHRIEQYVQGGGTFVGSYRLGVKDEHSRIVDTPLPGRLRRLMGASVEDYRPLYDQKIAVAFRGPLQDPEAPLRHLGGHPPARGVPRSWPPMWAAPTPENRPSPPTRQARAKPSTSAPISTPQAWPVC